MRSLEAHCRKIAGMTKGVPKSPEHRAKLAAILVKARAKRSEMLAQREADARRVAGLVP